MVRKSTVLILSVFACLVISAMAKPQSYGSDDNPPSSRLSDEVGPDENNPVSGREGGDGLDGPGNGHQPGGSGGSSSDNPEDELGSSDEYDDDGNGPSRGRVSSGGGGSRSGGSSNRGGGSGNRSGGSGNRSGGSVSRVVSRGPSRSSWSRGPSAADCDSSSSSLSLSPLKLLFPLLPTPKILCHLLDAAITKTQEGVNWVARTITTLFQIDATVANTICKIVIDPPINAAKAFKNVVCSIGL